METRLEPNLVLNCFSPQRQRPVDRTPDLRQFSSLPPMVGTRNIWGKGGRGEERFSFFCSIVEYSLFHKKSKKIIDEFQARRSQNGESTPTVKLN